MSGFMGQGAGFQEHRALSCVSYSKIYIKVYIDFTLDAMPYQRHNHLARKILF